MSQQLALSSFFSVLALAALCLTAGNGGIEAAHFASIKPTLITAQALMPF